MIRPNQSQESDEKTGSERLGLLRQPEITWHPRKREFFLFICIIMSSKLLPNNS